MQHQKDLAARCGEPSSVPPGILWLWCIEGCCRSRRARQGAVYYHAACSSMMRGAVNTACYCFEWQPATVPAHSQTACGKRRFVSPASAVALAAAHVSTELVAAAHNRQSMPFQRELQFTMPPVSSALQAPQHAGLPNQYTCVTIACFCQQWHHHALLQRLVLQKGGSKPVMLLTTSASFSSPPPADSMRRYDPDGNYRIN
jgi:hypothetical protein